MFGGYRNMCINTLEVMSKRKRLEQPFVLWRPNQEDWHAIEATISSCTLAGA